MRTIGRLVIASHPIPTVAVTALGLTVGIAFGVTPPTLAILGGALLFGQLSVGWSNDWIDANRDRTVARSSKPVAVGTISVALVRRSALVAVALALLITAFLGWTCLIAHACAIISAWLYNAGLKKTVVSWLPFAVSFSLLPAIASLALSPPRWPTVWIIAAAGSLGVAAHFTNVLPDLADDKTTGVHGLPHRIGATRSGIAAFGLLGTASGLVILGVFFSPVRGNSFLPADLLGPAVMVVGAVTVGIISCGVFLIIRDHVRPLLFHLIIAGALTNSIMIAVAGNSLLST